MMWYEKCGKDGDVAVSTRIRLARNLKTVPFPNAMSREQKRMAAKDIADSVMKGNSVLSKDLELIELDKLSDIEKKVLAEQHLISPAMLEGSEHFVLLNKDRSMSIMLMEEDHIRLQVILPGLDLDEAWNLADKVDNVLEEGLEYAFDEDFGYLTSCPTNTGTGLRASVMLHLPALALSSQLPRLIDSLTKLGIAVRGLYGEGSEAYGNLFQFSNQITMGANEHEIIEKLKSIVLQIIDRERETQKQLKKTNSEFIKDKVWRSYGILKYAHTISSNEAKALLSDVRLGQNMGIIPYDEINPMELSVITEPAYIIKSVNKNLNATERDKYRADILRQKLR
ncbi:MAG: protein arginine kinase [Clostridia bacterium]|nr:protein arginine kinase [Clostridia bacterium]